MEDIPLYRGKRKNILIISGGGIKGIAALGSLTKLKELEIIINPEIYCGSSIGSVICFLLSIGYEPEIIYSILEQIDFINFVNYDLNNIFEETCFGLSSIQPIMNVIISMIKKKNISTKINFKDLFKLSKSKLFITGTCIDDGKLHYFSVDHTPEMEVLKAMLISISIPLIFKPFKYDNKLWIDGGCTNNYPIDLFHDKLIDVIGIYLNDEYEYSTNIDNITSYFLRIIKVILQGHNSSKIEYYKNQTININCPPNFIINWEITTEKKKELFDLGYNITTNFFD